MSHSPFNSHCFEIKRLSSCMSGYPYENFPITAYWNFSRRIIWSTSLCSHTIIGSPWRYDTGLMGTAWIVGKLGCNTLAYVFKPNWPAPLGGWLVAVFDHNLIYLCFDDDGWRVFLQSILDCDLNSWADFGYFLCKWKVGYILCKQTFLLCIYKICPNSFSFFNHSCILKSI